MQSVFESWIGRRVVLHLGMALHGLSPEKRFEIKVSLRGTLLNERSDTLLMQPEIGSEVEVPKNILLAIEEASYSSRSIYSGAPSSSKPTRVSARNYMRNTLDGLAN